MLITALGLWTQSIAILGLGVQRAVVIATAAGRRNLWRWGLALVAAFALYAPWPAISAAQASPLGHSHGYLGTPGGHEVFRVLRTDYGKEPWRDAVEHIAAVGPPERTAALVPFDVDPFRYYNLRQPVPVTAYEVPHPEVPFASDYTETQLEEMERAARDRAARFDEVCVVVRSPNSEIRRELARRTERAAASDGRELVAREMWNSMTGPLRLARYRRPTEAGADSSAGR